MKNILRGFIFFFGLFLKSFGFSCIILSNLGTGAWEALYVGLSKKIGLSVGLWIILFGTVIILINALLLKQRPTFLSLVTVLFLGGLIDLWLHVLRGHSLDLTKQIIVFSLGLLFAALGVAIYVQARFALTPLDQLMYALSHKLGTNLMVGKTVGELGALILAMIIRGPIGVGTIVFTLFFGPLIQWFMRWVQRLIPL